MIHASLQAVADSDRREADHMPLARSERQIRADRPADLRDEALWKSAPWLAGLSSVCAAVIAWPIAASGAAALVGGWLALVIFLNVASLRIQRRAMNYPLVRIGRSQRWRAGEALVHAALWAALPAFALAGQAPATQLLIAGALGTMIAGAFLIALAPVAATLWAMVLAGALLWGGHHAAGAVLPVFVLLLMAYLAVILTGCLMVERLLCRYMDAAARERARRDAITLLLREYEDRGAGWLWQIDSFGLFTYVSPHIAGLLGRTCAQMLGRPISAVFGGLRLGPTLATRESFASIELQIATPDGPRWIALSGSPIEGPGGSFHGFRGVGADITEAHRSQERLTRMASNDTLTGLPNRQRMREILSDAIAGAAGDGMPCAIMFLDLDGFKPVNDTFGHPTGDAVLRGVAQRMAAAIGGHGRIGRVGGDEFAVVLDDGRSRADVAELAATLISAATAPFHFEKGEVRIGLSVGCAFAPDDGDTVEELLLKADLALYEAKSRGGGTFRAFAPAMQRVAEDRAALEHDLRQALRLRQLSLHYQPVLDSATCTIRGFEALLRWHHPERGLIPPSEFLPIAEETGIIGDIGDWSICTACRDASTWPDPLYVSVNVSPRQLAMSGFANGVADALAASALAPDRLHLEIPERVFLTGAETALAVLRRMRAMRVGLALDNFGLGHAALGHVSTNLFDTLKLDGRFLREALAEPQTASLVRAIVLVADSFRMNVVAERIEADDELARVEAIGCTRFQGFLAAAAMPAGDVESLVGPQRAPADAIA